MSKAKTTSEKKEEGRKAFLRGVLTKTYGKYKELEEDVEKAYERCKGMEY
jgi:hypothetical protein